MSRRLIATGALFRGLSGLFFMGLREPAKARPRAVCRPIAPQATRPIPSPVDPETQLADEQACRYLTSKQLGFTKVEARAIVKLARQQAPNEQDVERVVHLCLHLHGQRFKVGK